MTAKRDALARRALDAALKARHDAGRSLWDPICVFDLVAPIVSVRFVDIPSMEGMYSKDPKAILVNANRPLGRQAFSCGHEFGHHVFGHGAHIDKLMADRAIAYDDDEFLADCFAGYLLMPRVAASKALNDRGWKPEDLDAQQVYRLGNQFGMTFEATTWHLRRALKLIPEGRAVELAKSTPKSIRKEILGRPFSGELLIVDQLWAGRPIDLAVGDAMVLPQGCEVEGTAINMDGTVADGDVFVGTKPGQVRIHQRKSGWASFARVCKKGYSGLASYRHLEDEDGALP